MLEGIKLLCVSAICLAAIGCGPLTFTVGTGPADSELTFSTVLEDDAAGRDRIAMIDVAGMITNSSPRGLLYQGDNPVSVLHEKLEAARKDPHVKAVVLRLNTPGGTVTATDAMYREVERFKDKSGKPVIALMMDVAASGGYYLACASDEIVAYPTTVTASIGVILQTISLKPAMDRFGISAEAFTSGPNKAAGSPFENLTDDHRAVFNDLVNDFYVRFRKVVRENRPKIPEDKFDMVTDGRVVTGDDALALGLVDSLGDLYDAFEAAKRRADIDDASLILYHRKLGYVGSPYASATAPPIAGPDGGDVQINLAQFNFDGTMPIAGTRVMFLYMWQPGM